MSKEGRACAVVMLHFRVVITPPVLNDVNIVEDGKPGSMTITTKVMTVTLSQTAGFTMPIWSACKVFKRLFPTFSGLHELLVEYNVLVEAFKVKVHPCRAALEKAAPEAWESLRIRLCDQIESEPLTGSTLWYSYLVEMKKALSNPIPPKWLQQPKLDLQVAFNKLCDCCKQVIFLLFIIAKLSRLSCLQHQQHIGDIRLRVCMPTMPRGVLQ
jgi:hypothetical protein